MTNKLQIEQQDIESEILLSDVHRQKENGFVKIFRSFPIWPIKIIGKRSSLE